MFRWCRVDARRRRRRCARLWGVSRSLCRNGCTQLGGLPMGRPKEGFVPVSNGRRSSGIEVREQIAAVFF
eukprot:7062997-Pyramimonas_sp.AAC.1